jgi:hypothetical protein
MTKCSQESPAVAGEIRTSGSTRGSSGLGNPRPLLSTPLFSVVEPDLFSLITESTEGHRGAVASW